VAFGREQAGVVKQPGASKKDRFMAQFCLHCPVCNRARRRQRGAAFWLVKRVETGVCPFCRAYERVYGRKAHEPPPE